MSLTPILDGEQPLPVRKVHWALALLIGFAIGGVLIAVDRARGSPDPLIPPRAFPLIVVAFYIAIFMHELGHLIAGATAGFELRAFMVGAFLCSKESGGWRFQFVVRNLLWGGLTAQVATSEDNLTKRYLRVVMGGPAASLALLMLALLLPGGLLIRLLFWVNLILTISVCVPYTAGCFPNDAKLILLLTRKGAVGDRIIAILYLLFLDTRGKQPGEWPAGLVEKLDIASGDTSRLPVALGLLLSLAAERKDPERTAELLERALAICNKMLPDARRGFLAAASCYHSFQNRDAARAVEWLKRAHLVKTGVSRKDWDSRSLAGVSYANGDYARSADLLTRYVAFLDRQSPSGMIITERARTLELVKILETQL